MGPAAPTAEATGLAAVVRRLSVVRQVNTGHLVVLGGTEAQGDVDQFGENPGGHEGEGHHRENAEHLPAELGEPRTLGCQEAERQRAAGQGGSRGGP